ncbi:nucleoporin GLE1 isoform X2 [Cephus cinctus]|uniref:mRNA export factor GLE1 n=1 Tax=Cephus cinctus TaxID=211228 RepID=A0AAJ7FLA1_CEPCN|nr:nucleoporin GLE1 isoform X2 [Cephus cinctus]
MPHFVDFRDNKKNMNDTAAEFPCLKASILRKASNISGAVDQVTIGPDSVLNNTNTTWRDNIENEQNGTNVKELYSPNIQNVQTSTTSTAKISTSGITFSVRKIFLENEIQRREEVRKAIVRRWQQMEESERALQVELEILKSTMALKRAREEAEEMAKREAEEARVVQLTEIRRKHEQQLSAQRIQERQERLRREAIEHIKLQKKKELTDKVAPFHAGFLSNCQNIGTLSKSCKDRNAAGIALLMYATELNELNLQMEAINQKARMGELTAAGVCAAERIAQQSTEILNNFRSEIERSNELCEKVGIQSLGQLQQPYEALNNPQESQEKITQPEEISESTIFLPEIELKSQENQSATVTAAQEGIPALNETPVVELASNLNSTAPQLAVKEINDNGRDVTAEVVANVESNSAYDVLQFVDKESLKLFVQSQEFLEHHMAIYADLLRQSSSKEFRFECQKAINIPVNAISGVSGEHLRDKYERLQQLLSGKFPGNVTSHPQGIAYCKDVLAKKIVSQGETLISSKPEMAFPVAAVAVALWNEHPDFGELLMAHFHKTCPYTVPIFLPQQKGQSNEDYYRSLGYKYGEDGTVEKQDKYLKRMSGLIRLYASIIVTRQRRGVTKTHPHGLQNAWRWLAAILNIEPRPDMSDVCATLLRDMLDVAGSALWNAYPKQFMKLLMLLVNQYYPRVRNMGGVGGGPMARLEEFLKNSLSRGSIPAPEGQLAPNFW